ncbi:hypothetical protein [Stappia sp. ES.058]|uniref:hypothetical protein n=1 Tax=Stappia sp. ES.058 TaxID=1881061 RepID=UPI00087A66DE|nr:hypothetical protein [Stappia sp. ES.058]SDU38680.1 hypothetical protein SAMN05428979_3390 [Stappia sp. ES.058]
MISKTTGRLFFGAFKALFANFETFLKICWAWFAIFLVAQMAVSGLAPQDPQTVSAGHLVVSLAFAVVYVIGNASIAVAWHRCLLMEERPGWLHLAVGGRELRYAGKFVQIILMVMAMVIPIITTLVLLTAGMIGIVLAVAAMVFFILPMVLRFSLVLPAVALDEPLGFGEAFSDSEGLGLPMSFAAVGLSLVIVGGTFVVGLLAVGAGGASLFAGVAVFILTLALQISATALQVSILTGGYYIMRERQMPSGGGPGTPQVPES